MFEAELWNVNAYGDHLPRAHWQCNSLVLCLVEDLKYDELLMLVETTFSVLKVMISYAKVWNRGGEADQ